METELSKALEEYNELLIEEIESLVGIANVHGWRSKNVEKGIVCREKIAKLKELSMQSNHEKWDDALTDAIEETEGSIKPYTKIKKILSEKYIIIMIK